MSDQVIGTELFHRTMEWADKHDERGDLMRKVWQGTPWIVDAYTGSIGNHGRYREIMDWCRERFGPESSPIHGNPGQWRSGSATVIGYTWMGFATKEMMDEFMQQWGDVPEEETAVE